MIIKYFFYERPIQTIDSLTLFFKKNLKKIKMVIVWSYLLIKLFDDLETLVSLSQMIHLYAKSVNNYLLKELPLYQHQKELRLYLNSKKDKKDKCFLWPLDHKFGSINKSGNRETFDSHRTTTFETCKYCLFHFHF